MQEQRGHEWRGRLMKRTNPSEGQDGWSTLRCGDDDADPPSSASEPNECVNFEGATRPCDFSKCPSKVQPTPELAWLALLFALYHHAERRPPWARGCDSSRRAEWSMCE